MLVLWLLYLAYTALRAYVIEPTRRARFSSVLGIVAFLDVPIIGGLVLWAAATHRMFVDTEAADRRPMWSRG